MYVCIWICLMIDVSLNVIVCVSRDIYVIINYCKFLC